MKESSLHTNHDNANFGFRKVSVEEKPFLVRSLFDSVSIRYDLMNDLMSMGVHRWWKHLMIEWLNPRPGMTIADVAGGTGDIALGIVRREPRARVLIVDLTESMVVCGRDRVCDAGYAEAITTVVGDAERLPLPARSVDALTISFGLRNVTNIEKVLIEMRRVLKPGGHFLCLEFSHITLPVVSRLYDMYSFHFLPWLGEVVANNRSAYEYLVESIRIFPPQAGLVDMMKKVGFVCCRYRNLAGGIAAVHSGWRI